MTTKSKSDIAVSMTPRSTIVESPIIKQITPIEEVERLFERLMPQAWMPAATWNWPIWRGLDDLQQSSRIPSVDIIDYDQEILIRVELPGVEKKDIDVSVSDHSLNIKGCTKRPESEEKYQYFRCEISQGDFSRKMELPNGVDSTRISASLQDGVLEIHLPKNEQIKRRSVEVK